MKQLLVLFVSLLVIHTLYVANGCTTNSLVENLSILVEDALASRGGVATATINDYRVVCRNTARTRGTYTSVSVLVNMTCSGGACPSGDIQQFEFMCDGALNWFSASDNFAVPDGAMFTTPLRTDCGMCGRLPPASQYYDRYDNITHCVGCSDSCSSGLRECYGLQADDCCVGIDNNSCVNNCTAPGRPLATANYTCTIYCDPLMEPSNTNIVQSNGDLLNSVATYNCVDGYELQGNRQRTCQVTGKSTVWSGMEPSCTRTMPNSTDLVCERLVVGNNQKISYSTNCTVELGCQASYSCDKGYQLMGGANYRTCSLPSDMMPVWEGVAPTCEAKGNVLTQAEIAGIGIGVAVVVAVALIVIVVIVIVVLSRV